MTAGPSTLASTPGLIGQLRSLAVRGLARMYRANEQCFVFRVRRSGAGVVSEGLSRRYTAIVLIGLASDRDREMVLSWHCRQDVCARLVRETRHAQNLGDVALTLWAATALGHPDRRAAWEHLGSLRPAERPYPVVELSWALAALCLEEAAPHAQLRDRLARRLIAAFEARSGIFPHVVGASTRGQGNLAKYSVLRGSVFFCATPTAGASNTANSNPRAEPGPRMLRRSRIGYGFSSCMSTCSSLVMGKTSGL